MSTDEDTRADVADTAGTDTRTNTGSRTDAGTSTGTSTSTGVSTAADADVSTDTDTHTDTDTDTSTRVSTEEDPDTGDDLALQEPDPVAHGLVEGESPAGAAEEDELLDRWSKIQVFFVKDPRGAVTEAEALITEIVEARRKAFDAHRASLTDRWRETDADTEELRLVLNDYRKVVSVLFPRLQD